MWLDAHLASFDAGDYTDACILWPFSINGGDGGRYPQIKIAGATIRVTRYIVEHLLARPLADDEVVRHWCDTPRCVNPAHLEIGTHVDNMADMRKRKRSATGERNGAARLTANDVRDIRAFAADCGIRRGDLSQLARTYGVSPQAMTLILTGELWREPICYDGAPAEPVIVNPLGERATVNA